VWVRGTGVGAAQVGQARLSDAGLSAVMDS
jgi:hypothetical protein